MTIMEITEITQPGILSRTSLPEIIVRLRQLSRKTQPASMMSPQFLPEDLQARDQAGAQAFPCRGVCGCPQGGLHQVQNQPQTCQEARRQEVVLRAL